MPHPTAPPMPQRVGTDALRMTLLARWVWDGRRLVSPGVVVVESGRWKQAGDADAVAPDVGTPSLDLGRVLLTPGLVNFHTHLELGGVARPAPPDPGDEGFVDWLLEVMARGPRSGDEAAQRARAGLEQCQRFGVYEVHDITRHPREVRRALDGQDVHVISYGEVTGMASRRARAQAMLDAACDTSMLGPASSVRPGISPHAPYSTERTVYQACGRRAAERGWPVSTHLGEVAAERVFLSAHDGPFRRLWDRLGGWSDDVPTATLAELQAACGPGVLIAHGNDLAADELAASARSAGQRVVVVHCPRTHAYFRRPPFDLAARLSSGIALAVGTDSLASSPDLNVLAELRELAKLHPHVPATSLFSMAIADVARAPVVLAWSVPDLPDPLEWLLGRQRSPAPQSEVSTM
ncbi:MAG: amidohydrolase family protein [Tepidisphaerales bacterium]